MAEFTSGLDPMRVAPNHDPQPWTYYDDLRLSQPLSRIIGEADYRPRPEFDVLDNPILAAFREGAWPTGLYSLTDDAADYLRALSADQWAYASDQAQFEVNQIDATPEQIEHARRVLSKLAALA